MGGGTVFNAVWLLSILPEGLLLILALVVLGVDLALPAERKRSLGIWTAAGLLIVLVASFLWPASRGPAFGGMVRVDSVGQVFRAVFLLGGILVALMSMDFRPLPQDGPYYGVLLFSLLGMCLMAVAENLVMLYVAIELTSISAYILVGYLRETPLSSEAGLKYFLFGAFTSAVMLYGLSLLYGTTGGIGYEQVAAALTEAPFSLAMVGFLMVVVGLGFKVAMVPMHFWTPDVYQGAPTPITAFISVASKAAGFAVLVRALHFLFPALEGEWVALVVAISMVTMTLGNLFAIPQRNIKRMLAYSSVAQAGYILIGVAAASRLGVAAMAFYLIVYTVTNIAAFGVVVLVSNLTGSEEINTFAGLSRRSPFLAWSLMIALFSLGGVPPFGGFVGKLFLFAGAVQSGLIALAVVGVLNVIVSLYYYLNVVKVAFERRSEQEDEPLPVPVPSRWVLGFTMAAIVLLGVLGAPIFNLVWRASAAWF
ncbi:MAG: NADH-quinone oxidoreductase subunit N [Anaerolineae bacterium]